MGEHI